MNPLAFNYVPPPPQYTHLRFTYHLVAMIKMEYPSFILKVGVIVSLSLSLFLSLTQSIFAHLKLRISFLRSLRL